MMPDFTTSDVGTPGREWWDRWLPQVGPALAVSLLLGLLIGGGLAVRQVSLDTLMLWGKYQFARSANGIGLPEAGITWPGEGGEMATSVGELLQTPGLDAWAEQVSRRVAGAAAPALFAGLLAFAATLLWSTMKTAPDPVADDHPEPVEAARETMMVEAEQPLPVTLPPIPPPPVTQSEPAQPPIELPLPVTLPHLPEPAPAPSRVAAQPDKPVAPPKLQTDTTPRGKKMLSYETHWGITQLPFENVPDPNFYFPTTMHEEALHRMLYGIQTGKGALMLTGEVGCGKTLLSRELGLHLSGEQYDLALIANPSFGVEHFLTEVVYQLGMQPPRTKVELLHMLNERLLDNHKKNKQTVIVVDEAQAIPDDKVFEELRLLLNFQLNDRFLLTIVLMGQPELNDRVMALKQFAQRISIKYHLGFFTEEQTVQYIQFRMNAVKCAREVFTKDALQGLYKYSGGVPRNINTLCDLCLLIGYMERAAVIELPIVERAAAERGQLGLF